MDEIQRIKRRKDVEFYEERIWREKIKYTAAFNFIFEKYPDFIDDFENEVAKQVNQYDDLINMIHNEYVRIE